MAPTPVWMTRSRTSVCSTLSSASSRAPTEPCTSPLMMMLSSLSPPSLMRAKRSSSDTGRRLASSSARRRWSRSAGHLAGRPLVLDHAEALAGVHDAAEARAPRPAPTGRPSRGGAGVVGHRADAPEDVAGDDHVAHAQGAALHQQRGDRAAARVEARLDDGRPRPPASGWPWARRRRRPPAAPSRAACRCRVRSSAETCTNSCVPPQSEGMTSRWRELLLDPVRVGADLVHLVDGDHERHLGGARVVDRLHRLRHDAVVGRHHDDGDVGDLGAAGAHGRERLVARRVQEGDLAAVVVHLVGADVLGDAAGLARGHLGGADRVEQRRLAVVDVAHDVTTGAPGHQVRLGRRRTPRRARPPPRRARC